MLSTENPPSPDPLCSCSSQLIKGSDNNLCSDEKASHGNNQPLQLKVDLSKQGFDDLSIKQLSNFSIRDYVFSSRDKSIKTHWPFSPRKLQLCLKHGVKDVLPPFESLECLRINSLAADITVKDSNSSSDLKITSLSQTLLSSSPSNDRRKLASHRGKNKSFITEEDKEYRSTTASLSCSDNRIIKSPSEPETQDSPELLPTPASSKVFCNTQNKRRGLLVKLSSRAVPQSTKDAMKASAVADTMSSKVCPVCKTFSSSSNTTLNAHIDQCLSGGPASNGMENSKVIKHRVKPRKTRTMVDIYATAGRCTLEDLDRRNGTNWASGSGQAHCLETNSRVRSKENVEKDHPLSSMKLADKDVEDSVYVDSTGTKLRILSKLADRPSSDNAGDDCSVMKLAKGDKGTILLSSRKKYLVQNFKLLKSSSHAEISDDQCHKTTDGDQRNASTKKGCKKLVPKHRIELCDQVKVDDLGMVKQWVGSKRTTLKKKKKMKGESHRISKTMKNLRVKSGQTQVRDIRGKGIIESCTPLPAESLKRKKNLPFHSQKERMKHLHLRMRKEINDDTKRSDHLMHSTYRDQGKDDSSALECFNDLRNGTEAFVSSSSGDEDMRTNVSSGLKADVSFTRSRMSKHQTFSPGTKDFGPQKNSSLDHKKLFRGKSFSSLQQNLSSVKHLPAADSSKTLLIKRPSLRKRKLCYVSDSDDEAIMSQPEGVRKDDVVGTPTENEYPGEQLSDKSSDDRFTNLKSQKKIGGLVNSGKGGDLSSSGLIKPFRSNSHCIARNADFCVNDDVTAGIPENTSNEVKEVQSHEELAEEPTCRLVVAGAITTFGNSLSTALPQTPHYVKAGDKVTEAWMLLHGEQETIHTDNDRDLAIANGAALVESDADKGHGNYYGDIDPIPIIPGPPGSFLPSPRHMGSDELHGISSLTTCRLPSSEDEQEVVRMDSSDSPVSATSIVSNSIADGSNSASVIDRSVQPPHVPDEGRCESLEVKSGGTTVERSSSPIDSDAGAERKEETDKSRTNMTSPHYLGNSQPCCCSMKGGVFQPSSLDFQESQLLKRRNMNSLPLFPVQNLTYDDKYNAADISKLRSGIIFAEELLSEHKQAGKSSSTVHDKGRVSHSSYESPSPSTPNPILRLMGKNLLVVNKEDNPSPQTRPNSAIGSEHTVQQCFKGDASKVNIHSQRSSLSNITGQGPPMLNNSQSFNPTQHIEYGSSNGFPTPAGFMDKVMFPRKSFSGNYKPPFEGFEYSVGFSPNPMKEFGIYGPEKVQVQAHVPTRPKEVIVIDDSTEDEAMNLRHAKPIHHHGGGVLAHDSSFLRNDVRNENTSYIFQAQNRPPYSGTQLGHNSTHAEVPYSFRMQENIEKWNDLTPQRARVLHRDSFPASSPLPGHPLSPSSLCLNAGFSLHKSFS